MENKRYAVIIIIIIGLLLLYLLNKYATVSNAIMG